MALATSGRIKGPREGLEFPQGLEPFVCEARIGTAEAVPFQIGFYETSSMQRVRKSNSNRPSLKDYF